MSLATWPATVGNLQGSDTVGVRPKDDHDGGCIDRLNQFDSDQVGVNVTVSGLPPLAHEDDPARAARAALTVQAALGKLGALVARRERDGGAR
jgi:hypothetical protein